MKTEDQQLEALQDIRKMMKESSKFLSLSGLSGVFAGIYALIGAFAGRAILGKFKGEYTPHYEIPNQEYESLVLQIALICAGVLFFSIITALYFTNIKAKKNHQKLFDHTSKKLFWTMFLPLLAGGTFCLALIYHGKNTVPMVCPVMLIFYGLAVVNASRYTMTDVRYLGILEVTLGILASFFLGSGLLFWALGFGVLHIIYGSIMWFKYDRN